MSSQADAVVISHHAKRNDVDHLGNDGVNLARHDRRTRLQRGKVNFGKTGSRTGSQEDRVARNFRELHGHALQRG